MLRFFIAVTSFLFLLAPASQAQQKPLVELFVSQNCPACPDAQQNILDLAETEGPFLQLIWVVDYWDYLGEPDKMALPESTYRQRVYAENLGIRGPYTPQLIVDGRTHTAGNRKEAVRGLLQTRTEVEMMADLDIKATDTGLSLSGNSAAIDMEVTIMTVTPMSRYGLELANAVTHVSEPVYWSGGDMDLAVACAGRCVAVVQEINCGPVFTAIEFGPDIVKASVDLQAVPVGEQ